MEWNLKWPSDINVHLRQELSRLLKFLHYILETDSCGNTVT